jgi:hypothetical protein
MTTLDLMKYKMRVGKHKHIIQAASALPTKLALQTLRLVILSDSMTNTNVPNKKILKRCSSSIICLNASP